MAEPEDNCSPETRVAKVDRIWREEYGSSPERAVAELLADVRHFCDRHGLDYAERDRTAHGYYIAEVYSRTA